MVYVLAVLCCFAFWLGANKEANAEAGTGEDCQPEDKNRSTAT
jgi:hypothetical protein